MITAHNIVEAHPPPSPDRWRELRAAWGARAAVPLQGLLASRAAGRFGILMYHRIAPHIPGLPAPTWNVTPQRFRAQLEGLLAQGYQAWPLRKVLECSRTGEPVPPKTFVVTFDDGYANVHTQAWPVLKELRVPATVFLATAYLDGFGPFPFDDWPAAGSDRAPAETWTPLSTVQCWEMLNSGLVELGAHTHTHADFRNRPDTLRSDLRDCRDVLASRFGVTDVTFAFPYGTKRLGFAGPVLSAAAKQVGMLCSLTTESELVVPGSDPFDWGRFTADGFDTAATLAAKLDGWHNTVRDLWRRVKSWR